MPNHISNEDIKKDLLDGKFQTWWGSKTQAEKDWYFRFWARCSSL